MTPTTADLCRVRVRTCGEYALGIQVGGLLVKGGMRAAPSSLRSPVVPPHSGGTVFPARCVSRGKG